MSQSDNKNRRPPLLRLWRCFEVAAFIAVGLGVGVVVAIDLPFGEPIPDHVNLWLALLANLSVPIACVVFPLAVWAKTKDPLITWLYLKARSRSSEHYSNDSSGHHLLRSRTLEWIRTGFFMSSLTILVAGFAGGILLFGIRQSSLTPADFASWTKMLPALFAAWTPTVLAISVSLALARLGFWLDKTLQVHQVHTQLAQANVDPDQERRLVLILDSLGCAPHHSFELDLRPDGRVKVALEQQSVESSAGSQSPSPLNDARSKKRKSRKKR